MVVWVIVSAIIHKYVMDHSFVACLDDRIHLSPDKRSQEKS